MKIKDGFELRNICGENIIISQGKENINFTKIITLNESAAQIWNDIVGKEFTLEEMVQSLTTHYEVDPQTALIDCKELIEDWRKVGFIE